MALSTTNARRKASPLSPLWVRDGFRAHMSGGAHAAVFAKNTPAPHSLSRRQADGAAIDATSQTRS